MDELAEFKRTFFQECDELLTDLEGNLTTLKDGEADDELLNATFRAIHSIKGGAGAFGFDALVTFAHVFENVLDRLRSHELEADDAIAALLVRAGDVLADLVAAAQNDEAPAPGLSDEVLAELKRLAGADAGDDDDDDDSLDDADFAPVPAGATVCGPDDEPAAAAGRRQQTLTIRFAPGADMFRRANDPLLLVRELRRLGTLTSTVDASRLPPLGEMDPEGAYLSWEWQLTTDEPRETVEGVFEFVVDDCELHIEDTSDEEAAADTPDEAAGGGGEPDDQAAAAAAEAPADADREPRPAGQAPDPKPADSGGEETRASNPRSTPREQKSVSIRVELDKIDRLVNMVGELVITQAMLDQQSAELSVDQHAGLLHGIETLALRCRELQESVMAIRAQPVKSVFSRMSRLVRDLSASLGKEARLIVTGEETEVDKTVIEELAEPLTHMIRNCMDHGMEGPEERVAAGKPREGVIHLSAEHRSGRILISVSDDGRGIDRERVYRKAVEKELVPAGARPSDDEIDNMIFLPGFSTAEQISDVSGRGVGMDVVRRKIQDMGGRVGISSTPGRGSRFTLTLPLTLAVLDGMVVKVGSENYILPITSIVESIKPDAADVRQLAGGGEVLNARGDYIRLVFLNRLFAVPGAIDEPGRALVVLVETEARGHVGLVVDELLGQQQVVIKSLEANYRRIDGISGATILGNGMVALILDVERLSQMADEGRPHAIAAAAVSQAAGACH